MNDEVREAVQTEGPAAIETNSDEHGGIELGALPVKVSFHAGALHVPLQALANVGAGYVFELHKRLDDQTITVCANETPIAMGELVALGDLIGVRITRMLPKA